MARAVGAFFVIFLGITYLFGEAEGSSGSWYLLIALLVSAALAAAVSWWLRPDSERPEAGVFDERATRRAVRRGVVRTALVAVVWVGLGLTLLEIASTAWQTRGNRDSHFADVAGYGFFVSHPGFRLENGRPSCCSRSLRSLAVDVEADPRTATPLVPRLDVKLRLNLQNRLVGGPGALRDRDLPVTGVDVAEGAHPASPKVLERLPSSVVATAIVEFRQPLEIRDLYRVLQRHGFLTEGFPTDDVAIYLQPPRLMPDPSEPFTRRVAWPSPNVAQFQGWVKQLRTSDNGVLDDLQVPRVAKLAAIAETPMIFGCILDRASPKQLGGLLLDPAVESVKLGDIAIAAANPSS